MSCCTCGNNCNYGCGCRVIVLPDNPVSLYSAANINTQGIGVYDSTEGTEFDFRGIYSGNTSLVVALDAGNNAISLTLDIPSIIDDLPQATTTQIGVGETATDAEALAKASITTFLTPSNLAALGSTTIFAGLVELATDAETQAGVSTTLAVTPAGLASVVSTLGATTTWADAVARVAAVPDFAGQVGVQLDTDIQYISTGVAAGDFDMPVLMLNNTLNEISSQTTVTLPANTTFTFLSLFSNSEIEMNVNLHVMKRLDLQGGSTLYLSGVIAPDNTVLIVSPGTPGFVGTMLIADFVSTANTQLYGLPTSTLARTTFATYAGQAISNPPTQAEVQALDNAVVIVSQRLGALITDLMATLKPHA